jgi:hypothetical protein
MLKCQTQTELEMLGSYTNQESIAKLYILPYPDPRLTVMQSTINESACSIFQLVGMKLIYLSGLRK